MLYDTVRNVSEQARNTQKCARYPFNSLYLKGLKLLKIPDLPRGLNQGFLFIYSKIGMTVSE